MSAAPKVSIVVPVLNGMPTVAAMLASLQSQTGTTVEREIIVVDGGSTDGTAEAVQAAGATLIVEPKRGPAAARNAGLHAASGEIICHLDADSMASRTWLAEMIKPFEDERVVLVGGKTLSMSSETPAQRYMASSGRIDSIDYMNRPVFPFIPSRNMAVRRDAALAIGGWADECITGEDVDFCHRMLKRFPQPMEYQERAILLHVNRKTDETLARQAWGYGEGMAHLYERYPDEVRWNVGASFYVACLLAGRAVKAAALAAAERAALASTDAAEIARYDWLWTSSFWKGFYSFRRAGAYR